MITAENDNDIVVVNDSDKIFACMTVIVFVHDRDRTNRINQVHQSFCKLYIGVKNLILIASREIDSLISQNLDKYSFGV